MATRPVRFEFRCESDKLKFVHDLPSHLITADAAAGERDPAYMNSYARAMAPIVQAHQAECRRKASSRCENCDAPMHTILQTPTSWLHVVSDPFIVVYINSVCSKGQCEVVLRQKIQSMILALQHETAGQRSVGSNSTVEILQCKICGKTEDVKRCVRCKVIAYCGKNHQKEDWKVHKRVCFPQDV